MNSAEVRNTFIDYFKKNNHEHVRSSPLVPEKDPTLMFTNSGMVQFKNVFTGLETKNFNKATTSQKCVRAGGKHNDLENVGFTTRHHTFFEMLGNFSFGDYFKEQAIFYAWDLITKEYGINKDKLLVTIYHNDEESYGFWKKIAGLSDDKIIKISSSDVPELQSISLHMVRLLGKEIAIPIFKHLLEHNSNNVLALDGMKIFSNPVYEY